MARERLQRPMGKSQALDQPQIITVKCIATSDRIQVMVVSKVEYKTEDRKAALTFGSERARKSAFGQPRQSDEDCVGRG